MKSDERLHPVHIVESVGRVVAEGLHSGEVLEALARGVEERLVDAEVVGVPVHVDDRLPERDGLVPQGDEEGLVAVGRPVGLGERGRVPQWRSGGVAEIEAGVGLPDDHDSGRPGRARLRERLVQPGDVGRVAGGLLGRVRSGIAQVVAGSLDVDRCVGHLLHRPTTVLDAGHWLGDRGSGGRPTDIAEAARRRLDVLCHRVAAGRHQCATSGRTVHALPTSSARRRQEFARRFSVVHWTARLGTSPVDMLTDEARS